MKRILFISLLWLVQQNIVAQKVNITLIQTENVSSSVWHILDEYSQTVCSSYQYLRNDSVSFTLEANKRYFLQISVYENYNADTSLYSLLLEDEPILLVSSGIETGDHLFPFFTGTKEAQSKIVGGTDADISEFPWQAFLISGNNLCGASIISDNWIVTAAHCTKNSSGDAVPASKMTVKVGASNPYDSNEGKSYSISQVIVHEDYNPSTIANDIALLRISLPIDYENAEPIKLVSDDDVADGATDPGVMSWVTGWGLISVNPDTLPYILQKVQLPIISNQQAGIVWTSFPENILFAGYFYGNKDACNGDSGGPLAVPVYGEYKLAGITSWGSEYCDTYGAFTRVSDFTTWIRAKSGIPEEFKPPAPVGDTLICQGTESSQYSSDELADVTDYEWRIYPEHAGIISGNLWNASVLWDISRTGSAAVLLRVTIDGIVSDWSKLNINIVRNTTLLSQTGDTTLCAGQPLTISASAEGHNLNFSWYQNSNLIQSETTGILHLPLTTTDNSGNYLCEITGTCGLVSSDNLGLTVYPLTEILNISPDIEVPFDNDVTLEVNGAGYDLIYQWQKDNVLLDNTNTSQLVLQNVDANDIGLYRTTLTGKCGTELSDSIYVYVKKKNSSEDNDVYLWPTIVNSEFRVAFSGSEYFNVRIFNTLGRLVMEQVDLFYHSVVNISTLSKGYYIINVYNKDFSKTFRVIKK
jgi:Trypsin